MKKYFVVSLAILLLALIFVGNVPSVTQAQHIQRWPLELQGGPGGSVGYPPEDAMKPISSYKISCIVVSSGRVVDSIWILYDNKNSYNDNGCEYPEFGFNIGGRGGSRQEIPLEIDEYITEISGEYGRVIDSLTIKTSYGEEYHFGGNGGSTAFRFEAPPGWRIVDLWGRGGKYVDSISVILGNY